MMRNMDEKKPVINYIEVSIISEDNEQNEDYVKTELHGYQEELARERICPDAEC